MIPLRIGFDMDGTLADLGSAYAEVENRLFGPAEPHERPAPEAREAEQHDEEEKQLPERPIRLPSDHRHRVWRAIEETADFWTTLKPIDATAVSRLYQLACRHHWEVFFITQRPSTAGATVQSQTHRWLVEHGYPIPSVIPLSGGRGRAASALCLDYVVDDTPQNCLDVLSDSSARAILVVDHDRRQAASARKLGIGTAGTIHEALDLLVKATEARANPSLFEKLRKMVGWR
jgi:hypothetical protein